jgi:tetratricopeptide (TPR) repeat protein
VAIYAGWYASDVSGPFRQPDIEFMPGAFAYHLHSFSAATLRSTNSHWAGPLLARGAAATLGSVYEPYLSGTSDVATLLRNWLLHGFSFGEAAWSAEFGFSWQTTVVGDPLYRPWGTSLEERRMELERRNDRRLEWPIAMQMDRQLSAGKPAAALVAELRNLPLTRSSAVLSEKLGEILLLQSKPAEANTAYAQALLASPSPKQRIRLLLARANLEAAAGADAAALECLKEVVAKCPDYGEQLEFQRRLLLLAIKVGDTELTQRCHAAIRRLSGSEAVPPASGQAPPSSQPSSTNR